MVVSKMKRCVLQASPGSSRQLERFVAQCEGVEHLLGKDLVLLTGGREEDSLWLFYKPAVDGGKPDVAAQVVSSPLKKGGVFPTIHLLPQYARRLAQMREAEVCLFEFAGEEEVGEDGIKDGVAGMKEDTKDVETNKDFPTRILFKMTVFCPERRKFGRKAKKRRMWPKRPSLLPSRALARRCR